MDAATWESLLDELRARGWPERDGFLFAPEESLWFSIETPWHTSASEFQDCMVARLARCRSAKDAFPNEPIWQATVRDHESLVEAIAAVVTTC